MKINYLLLPILVLLVSSSTNAGVLFSTSSGGYSNHLDYSDSEIKWIHSDKKIEDRLALLDFASGFLKYAKSLDASLFNQLKVDINASSAEEAFSSLEKVSGGEIPGNIIGENRLKIKL